MNKLVLKWELDSARYDRWELLLETNPIVIIKEYDLLDDSGRLLTIKDLQYKVRALDKLGAVDLQTRRKK